MTTTEDPTKLEIRKVLVLGQVGQDKEDYLNLALESLRKGGRNASLFTVGKRMIENYAGNIDDRTILNLPLVTLDTLRRFAWKEIANDIEREDSSGIQIINTHAMFRWHHGLFPSIDLDLVSAFRPELIVVLIDDLQNIRRRLEARGTDFLELWEILAWREEEVWVSKFLAENLRKLNDDSHFPEFYLLPRSQGPELLCQLLTSRSQRRVYMSFPITSLPGAEKVKVDEFKNKISGKFIAFDPYALSERSIVITATSLSEEVNELFAPVLSQITEKYRGIEDEKLRWSPDIDESCFLGMIKLRVGETDLRGREVVSVIDAIDNQIIARDFLLIDQSDFVLMYIRVGEDGNPIISAGCQSEMVYGYSKGKPVYVVCKGGPKSLSPWVTQFSEVFEDLNSAFQYLSKKYLSN